MPQHPRLSIDLFAGAGGLSLGLARAGYRTLAAVESDSDAAGTYTLNHPHVVLIAEDILNVSAATLRESLHLDRGALALLAASPPCQGFSSLGSRRAGDARNDLALEVARFTGEFRPRAVVVENVPQFLRHPRCAELLARLRAFGYGCSTCVVDAVACGVPQSRRRAILVALRDRPAPVLPDAFAALLPRGAIVPFEPAGAVLARAAGLPGPATDPLSLSRTLSPLALARIRAVPPGGDHYDLPPDLRLRCHTRLGTGRRQTRLVYGRIRGDALAPTMTTRCTTVSSGRFAHPLLDRGLTLREAALFQTFPSRYAFVGSYGSVERQIGNAVAVQMARVVGLAVRRLDDDSDAVREPTGAGNSQLAA